MSGRVKIVQTLVVRDEADIVDAQIAYHLSLGVDFVIATDHQSVDGTTEILEAFARDGHLLRIPVEGDVHESRWRTEMARLAAAEHGADWVVNTDADEFWVPSGTGLREVLGAIPDEIGIVYAISRHFVPRPDDDRFFAERMTLRASPAAPLNDPTSPYRPHGKAAHRGHAEIVVRHGAHDASAPGLVPLGGWYVADVLHFPFRSSAQWARKGVRRVTLDKPLGQYVRASRAVGEGRLEEIYGRLVPDEALAATDAAHCALEPDTRVRDALRFLAEEEEPRSGPAPGARPRFRVDRSLSEAMVCVPRTSASRLAETAGLQHAELVRLHRHLDLVAARVDRVAAGSGR